MGRNKIKIEKIENIKLRITTFNKRKKGLIKKAMELSLLCDTDILLCILDNTASNKCILYESKNNFADFIKNNLINSNRKIDIMSNKDYDSIFNNKEENSSNNNEADDDIDENQFLKKKQKSCLVVSSNNEDVYEKDDISNKSPSKNIHELNKKYNLKVTIPSSIHNIQSIIQQSNQNKKKQSQEKEENQEKNENLNENLKANNKLLMNSQILNNLSNFIENGKEKNDGKEMKEIKISSNSNAFVKYNKNSGNKVESSVNLITPPSIFNTSSQKNLINLSHQNMSIGNTHINQLLLNNIFNESIKAVDYGNQTISLYDLHNNNIYNSMTNSSNLDKSEEANKQKNTGNTCEYVFNPSENNSYSNINTISNASHYQNDKEGRNSNNFKYVTSNSNSITQGMSKYDSSNSMLFDLKGNNHYIEEKNKKSKLSSETSVGKYLCFNNPPTSFNDK